MSLFIWVFLTSVVLGLFFYGMTQTKYGIAFFLIWLILPLLVPLVGATLDNCWLIERQECVGWLWMGYFGLMPVLPIWVTINGLVYVIYTKLNADSDY